MDYGALDRHDEARSLMERAIRAAEKTWGLEHPDYGVLVHTLGELELSVGRADEAESHLRRALEIYELQPSHEFTGLVLYQLAQICSLLENLDEAIEFLTRALDSGYVHNGSPLGFAEDTALSSLHGQPRFEALVSSARTALVR